MVDHISELLKELVSECAKKGDRGSKGEYGLLKATATMIVDMLQCEYQDEAVYYLEQSIYVAQLLLKIKRLYPHVFSEVVTNDDIEKIMSYEAYMGEVGND